MGTLSEAEAPDAEPPAWGAAISTAGSRWIWPAAAGALALGASAVTGWRLPQQIALSFLALLGICLIITWLGGALVWAEGAPSARIVQAGDRLIVRYRIHNRGPLPLPWIALQPQGLAALPVQAQLLALPPRAARTIEIALNCPSRGRRRAGGWTLRMGDPFGMFERVRSEAGRDEIVVYPRPLSLPDLTLPRAIGYTQARRGTALPQPSVTIRELRPYRPGDAPSRIHWLSTARLGALMVKEPEGEPASQAWVILDLRATQHYRDDEDEESVELAVSAARTVLDRLLGVRVPAGLLLAGATQMVQPDERLRQAEHLLETLACAAPGPGTLDEAIALVGERTGRPLGARRETVIAITPWIDDAWYEWLPALVHGGSRVLCMLLDTPGSGMDATLTAQAAGLRLRDVPVYRHSGRAG